MAVNQDEFNERHQGYMERHRIATEWSAELENQRRNRQNKSLILERFIREIETRSPTIKEFDANLGVVAVDKVTVIEEGVLVFRFKDGSEIGA